MAVLAASQVTVLNQWTEGGTNGRRRTCIRATVATSNDATGQGDATDNIPATVFGLTYLEESTVGIQSDNRCLLTAPSYDQTLLLLYNVEAATDGARSDPVNFVNTTFTVTVKGYGA
jgi:hypothetical protein